MITVTISPMVWAVLSANILLLALDCCHREPTLASPEESQNKWESPTKSNKNLVLKIIISVCLKLKFHKPSTQYMSIKFPIGVHITDCHIFTNQAVFHTPTSHANGDPATLSKYIYQSISSTAGCLRRSDHFNKLPAFTARTSS